MAVNRVETSDMALGGAPRAASAPQGQIREKFPETWIWKSAIAEYVLKDILLISNRAFSNRKHFIQEGQLSVSGERMCTILVNRLED